MTREEAFELLGLDVTASQDKIRERFKELAQQFHPDKGGDALAMARLYSARELALGRGGALALVPIDDVRSLVAREVAVVASRYESQEQKRRSIARVKARRTSTLKKLRKVVGLLGLTAAIFALLTAEIMPLLEQKLAPVVRLILIGIAFLSGLAFAVSSWRVEQLEDDLDEFSGNLSDKNTFITLMLRVIPNERAETFWSLEELETFVGRWDPGEGGRNFRGMPMQTIVHSFGRFGRSEIPRLPPEELAELLLAVGRERELLELTEEFGAEDGFVQRYKLIVPARTNSSKQRNSSAPGA